MRTKFEIKISKHKGVYYITAKNKVLNILGIMPCDQPMFGSKTKKEAEYFLKELKSEDGYFYI